jgi:hypothetical protein
LCDSVRAVLDELAAECGFGVEEFNIEADRTLFSRYRHEIPVVLIDGKELARGRIDERVLIAALVPRS